MIQISYKNKSIIVISDTHGKHRELKIPNCDILIHCGDVCDFGNKKQIIDFFSWFSDIKVKHKLFVSGNHDFPFLFKNKNALKLIPENVIFIENRIETVAGITFYGLDSAINLYQMPKISEQNIDFLITHVPPKSILDENIGCSVLRKFIKLQNPKFHLFGHAHLCGHKKRVTKTTTFINCCSPVDHCIVPDD